MTKACTLALPDFQLRAGSLGDSLRGEMSPRCTVAHCSPLLPRHKARLHAGSPKLATVQRGARLVCTLLVAVVEEHTAHAGRVLQGAVAGGTPAKGGRAALVMQQYRPEVEHKSYNINAQNTVVPTSQAQRAAHQAAHEHIPPIAPPARCCQWLQGEG